LSRDYIDDLPVEIAERLPKKPEKPNLEVWADIEANSEEEAVEEFEAMEAQSPSEPEITVEPLD